MPYGDFINQIPALGFLAIHATAFLIGAYFAWRSFGAGASLLGWGFSLFALAELSYMTYHLDWTVFLFAHTISEVLDLLAFILIFSWAARRLTDGARGRTLTTMTPLFARVPGIPSARHSPSSSRSARRLPARRRRRPLRWPRARSTCRGRTSSRLRTSPSRSAPR